jgi:hypothetical protein
MYMSLVADLRYLQAEDLEDPDLSFLRRWQKQELMELVQSITAAAARPGDRFDDNGAVWGSASGSGDDVDSRFDAALAKRRGNLEDFQEKTKTLIESFLDYVCIIPDIVDEDTETFEDCPGLPDGIWSCCMLVWIRFAQEPTLTAFGGRNGLSASHFRVKADCLPCLTRAFSKKAPHTSGGHALSSSGWAATSRLLPLFSRPTMMMHHQMVQQSLQGNAASGLAWQQDVVKSWFTNAEAEFAARREVSGCLKCSKRPAR